MVNGIVLHKIAPSAKRCRKESRELRYNEERENATPG
jgi:hypothetical protein